MFKKPIKIGAQNQLSGKDRKTMKNKLSNLFDEACVQKMLALNDKIISCKVSGSKIIIYNGNEYPLVVDGTGKNDYYPTIYACSAYQTLVKTLVLNEGVEAYIFNGANLMWPGVNNYGDLGQFKKDQVIGIKSIKGEIIAIGAMGCSFSDLQKNIDKSGIAVYILHYKQDKLWELGPKAAPQIIIEKKLEAQVQENKKQEEIVEVKKQKETQKQQSKGQKAEKGKKENKKAEKAKRQESPQQKQEKSEEEEEESQQEELDFMNLVHTKKNKQMETKVEKKKPVKFEDDDEEDNRRGKKKKHNAPQKQNKKKKKKQESDEQQMVEKIEDEPETKSVITSKLMDQYLKQSFLNVLKLSKVEADLPIDSGRFYMDYMLLARPEGVKLEIKDSSYKKLGKFYEEMVKQKFIQFKHPKDKKGQQGATITRIFWDNQEFRNFEPTIKKMQKKQAEEKDETQIESKKKLILTKSMKVETVYKPNDQLKKILFPKTVNYMPTQEQEQKMKEEKEEYENLPAYFSQHEIKALIEKYIDSIAEGKSKEKKIQKTVMLKYSENEFIKNLLFKEIEEYEENLAIEELGESDEQDKKKKKKKVNMFKIDRQMLIGKALKKCLTAYKMEDKENQIQLFKEGLFKGIQIIAEKANNKNITKVLGLQTFIVPRKQADEQLNGFSSMLQQKFACSVNLQNLPGKNAGKQVIVHGAFLDELEDIFTNEYKIKKEFITTQNKLGKKKKQ